MEGTLVASLCDKENYSLALRIQDWCDGAEVLEQQLFILPGEEPGHQCYYQWMMTDPVGVFPLSSVIPWVWDGRE